LNGSAFIIGSWLFALGEWFEIKTLNFGI